MNHPVRCACILALSTLSPFGLLAQPADWKLERFDMSNGLPQSSVLSVAMDSLGYAWLSTEAGLVRFDGMLLRSLLPIGGTKGGEDRMRDILRAENGGLLARNIAFDRFSIHAEYLVIPVAEHVVTPPILGGIPSIDLFVQAFDTSTALPGRRSWPTEALIMVPTTPHDWFVKTGDSLMWYHDLGSIGTSPLPHRTRAIFKFDDLLFAIDDAGASYCAHIGEPGLAFGSCGQHVPEGRIFWRSGDREAVCFGNGRFYLLTRHEGADSLDAVPLPVSVREGLQVNDVVWDGIDQQLLVGTDRDGLLVFRKAATTLDVSRGNPTGGAGAQFPLGHDSVLVFVEHHRALICSGGHCVTAPGFTPYMSNGGALDPAGNLLYGAGANGKDLTRYVVSAGRSEPVATCDAYITCLLREADTLWIGTTQGIERLIRGRHSRFLGSLHDPTHYGVQFIRRGPGGELWFGTNKGLYHVRNSDHACIRFEQLKGRCVRAMESLGTYWFVGTYGDGAYLLGDSLIRLPIDPEHAILHSHAAFIDAHDNLWISTNNGLLRAVWPDVERWIARAGPDPTYEWTGGGVAHRDLEFNGGGDPAYARLPSGEATFPTMEGLLRVWLDSLPEPRPPAGLIFEDVVVDGRTWPVDEYLQFPPGTKEIRINISMAYWGEPRSLDLSFGMDGENGQWFRMTPEQRQIVIMNPTPGEHELVIRNAGVPIKGDQPSLWFEVKPRFFRTTWGKVLILSSAAILFLLLFRWWSGRLERRNRQLETAVKERTRELSLSNERLQLTVQQKDRMFSILNHDIVSPLRFIERVARQAASDQQDQQRDTRASRETFEELSFAATRLHTNAQNLLNWVKHQDSRIEPRPTHVVVSLLVDQVMAPLRPQAAAKGIELLNEVPLDDVLLVDRDILGIILSNLLINAVSYTAQGRVQAVAIRNGQMWSMRIQDTGPGFPPRALEQLKRIQSGARSTNDTEDEGLNGLGYIIIQELMTLIGGRFEVSSPASGGARIDLYFS